MLKINRKNIWHDSDSNPEPTAWEPCCPAPTTVIYFWIIGVGNFGLKKKEKRPYWMNNFSCVLHMRRKITRGAVPLRYFSLNRSRNDWSSKQEMNFTRNPIFDEQHFWRVLDGRNQASENCEMENRQNNNVNRSLAFSAYQEFNLRKISEIVLCKNHVIV